MGRKRGRRTTAKKKAAPSAPSIQTLKLGFELCSLEIAQGHDGLLRGAPEPVIVLSAFHVTTGGGPRVRPLGRELVRFLPRGRFPLVVAPPSRSVLKARARCHEGDRVILLAVAIEEDSGADLERVYTHIQDLARIRVWEADAAEPSPVMMADLGALPASTPPFAARVHVLDDGADLRDACEDDEIIGAGLLIIAPHRSEDVYRIRFISEDRKNDWTAVVAAHIE